MPSQETELRRARAEVAGLIFEATLLRAALLERKAGFHPDQPRDDHGRWTDGVARGLGHLAAGLRRAGSAAPPAIRKPVELVAGSVHQSVGLAGRAVAMTEDSLAAGAETAVDAALDYAPPQVRAFLEAHRDQVNRSLGALQMAGGMANILGGGAIIADSGGVAAAAGAWMVAQGADDWDTGLRMLVSGKAQESNLSQALQGFGFSRDESEELVAATAGIAPSAALRMSPVALNAAADRVLTRDALAPFVAKPLVLTKDGSTVWNILGAQPRGDLWEIADNKRTGLLRTPASFQTFDQYSADKTVAVSNKTLDLERPVYNDANRKRVQATLKAYVDKVADFEGSRRGGLELLPSDIKERRLHLLVPAKRPTPGQTSQLAAAALYARSRGVKLEIHFGH